MATKIRASNLHTDVKTMVTTMVGENALDSAQANLLIDAKFTANSTDNLSEGSSNLYFTNARADARADTRAQLKIDALVGSAPGTLDTLQELGDALGDDPNFATTVTNSIATKLPLAGGTLTGDLILSEGSPTITLTDTDGNTSSHIKTVGSNMELHAQHGNMRFRVGSSGLEHMRIAPGGDISFYEDTGTTAKFFWDASAESLTLNSTLKVEGGTTNGFLQASGSLFQLGASTASDFVVYTNNTERMRIDSTGNFIVGGTSQISTSGFSVYGDQGIATTRVGSSSFIKMLVGSSGESRIDTANASRVMEVPSSGSEVVFNQGSLDRDFRVESDSNTHMLFVDAGSNEVGIGTSDPRSPLHVQTSHSSTDVTAANTNSTLSIGNSATGNGVYNAIKFAANQQDMYIMSFNNTQVADRRLGFFLGSVAGDAVADERLSIRGNGNVGIGTSNPLAPLHVNGNIVVGSGDNNQKIYMEGAVNDLNMIHRSTTENAMIMTSRHAMALIIDSNNDDGDTGTGSFSVRRNGTTITGSASCLEVIPNGNVGIGTSSPTTELDVAGTVTADQYNTDAALPTTKPSLLLDFANSKSLDLGITFTRSSAGTYYDGKTTAKAEENLIPNSEAFSSWTSFGSNGTLTSGFTSPTGTSTAWRLQYPQSTGGTYLQQTFSTKIGSSYTMSVYAKDNASGSQFTLRTDGGLISNTFSTTSSWQRYSFTFIATLTAQMIEIDNTSTAATDILIWGAQVEENSHESVYIPTTTTPIVKYQPKLLTASIDSPRFDHNPITGESKGLLIEGTRTNYSGTTEPTGTYQATQRAEYGIAPDGTQTAIGYEVNSNTVGGSTLIYWPNSGGASSANGINVTHSLYVKPLTGTMVRLLDNSQNKDGIFLLTGEGSVTSGSATTKTITHVGNQWYRITISYTMSGTASYIQLYTYETGLQGDIAFLTWGYQREIGSFASSFIRSDGGSSTSRGADRAQMIGPSFTSWFTPNNGSFYTEYQSAAGNNNHFVYQVSNGNNAAGIIDQLRSRFRISPDNQNYADINSGTIVSGTFHKIASSFAENDFAISLDGASVVTDTSGRIDGGADRITIGDRSVTNSLLDGHIKKLAFYPQRLSNATLQEMTKE